MSVQTYRGNALLKRANVAMKFTKAQAAEMAKCKKDPIYFIEQYVKIVTEDGVVPIKLRDYQKEFILSMFNNRFTIAMMGRQQGKTEAVRAFMIHYVIFNKQKTVGVLANKESTANEILSKIKISFQSLPAFMQVGVIEWAKSSVVFENGSRLLSSTTTSDSIRGYTLHACLIDEAAHIEKFDEFFSSVFPTISAGKQTKMILVSTPNGMNHFHKMWVDSEKNKNEYKRVFAKWDRVPGRDQKWKEATIAALNNNLDKFNQEYECDFIGSSGTLISGQMLRELDKEYEDPIQSLDSLHQYEKPIRDHHYVLVADVSEGKGLDYSAFSIIDVTELPYKQVCVFHDNWTTPMDYAGIIYNLALAYNSAYVLVEGNNMGGEVANLLWYEYEYETMFFTESGGRNGRKISSGFGARRTEVGIRTTVSVKSVGCSTLKLLVENRQLQVVDYNTISELNTFSKKGKSYSAEEGKTDDLVMGLVLFAWMTNQSFFKDLTDINTLMEIRQRSQQRLDEETQPFAFFDDGTDDIMLTDPPEVTDSRF